MVIRRTWLTWGCSKWWLVSKICPLIAGVFGIIANGFCICSLVQDWREYRPTQDLQDEVQGIKNPPWYVKSPATLDQHSSSNIYLTLIGLLQLLQYVLDAA